MRSRRSEIINRAGIKLSGYMEMPLDRHPFAYAILVHCFTCGKDLTSLREISRSLSLQGVAVLRFDFTGIGESEGDMGEKGFNTNIEDIIDISEYLEKNFKAPSLLIGHSLGGTAAIMAAEHLPSVKAVVTIGAPSQPAHVLKLFKDDLDVLQEQGSAQISIAGKEFNISRRFVEELQSPHLEKVIRELNRALLIFHSPQDNIVGVENATALYTTAMHPKSFISLDGADHLLSEKEDAHYIGSMIASWVQRYILIPEKAELRTPHQVAVSIGREKYVTEVRAGEHGLIADEPVKAGGQNFGPTPYDLVVAGLGTCTAMTLRMYADHKNWDVDEVTVHLQHSRIHAEDCSDCEEDNKSKLDQIERYIDIKGNVDEDQKKRLLQIANRCPVHRTLVEKVRIRTTFFHPKDDYKL